MDYERPVSVRLGPFGARLAVDRIPRRVDRVMEMARVDFCSWAPLWMGD